MRPELWRSKKRKNYQKTTQANCEIKPLRADPRSVYGLWNSEPQNYKRRCIIQSRYKHHIGKWNEYKHCVQY